LGRKKTGSRSPAVGRERERACSVSSLFDRDELKDEQIFERLTMRLPSSNLSLLFCQSSPALSSPVGSLPLCTSSTLTSTLLAISTKILWCSCHSSSSSSPSRSTTTLGFTEKLLERVRFRLLRLLLLLPLLLRLLREVKSGLLAEMFKDLGRANERTGRLGRGGGEPVGWANRPSFRIVAWED
jgi:hypothetical protein